MSRATGPSRIAWMRVIRAALSDCCVASLGELYCEEGRSREAVGPSCLLWKRVIRSALSDCCTTSLRGLSEDLLARVTAKHSVAGTDGAARGVK